LSDLFLLMLDILGVSAECAAAIRWGSRFCEGFGWVAALRGLGCECAAPLWAGAVRATDL